MKMFNILFPYDKPLPRGKGDELGLSGFYEDRQKQEADLSGCHPDQLRENIMADTEAAAKGAVAKNRVEDINDLLDLQ